MLITLPNAVEKAVINMAIDALLLESVPKGTATFRHYGWLESAATFGYAQSFKEVRNVKGKDIILCRRLSGGGIVDHRNDWTYSLSMHTSLPCAQLPATKIYEHVHLAITLALKSLAVSAYLSPCPKTCSSLKIAPELSSECFVSPTANDVLRSDGRKIAGAAMKRGLSGILIQGSMDREALPDKFDYSTYQREFISQLTKVFNLPNRSQNNKCSIFSRQRLEEEKKRFASDKWNRMR